MKVIYQKHIEERIRDAVYKADIDNKRIERIDVTAHEANELSTWLRKHIFVADTSPPHFLHYLPSDAGKYVGQFYGAHIYVEKP
jgi:hypothetical protein